MAIENSWMSNAAFESAQTWSAQGAIVNWSVGKGTGDADSKQLPLVMMNLTASFQRTLQKFYPIAQVQGKKKQINIGGAPRGTLQIGAIFAPYGDDLEKFLKAVAKECKGDDDGVTITIRPFGNQKCTGTAGTQQFNNIAFKLKNVELESLGVSVQGGEVAIVNFPTNYSFTGLDLDLKAPASKQPAST